MKKPSYTQLKNISIIGLTLILLAACQNGVKPNVADDRTHEVISEAEINIIDDYIAELDSNQASYVKCEETILGLTTEGTGLFAYYNADDLVKAEVKHFGEMGKVEEVIYLRNKDIIAIHHLRTNYNKPMYYDDFEIASTTESQFYFENQSPILWLKDGVEIDPSTEEFRSRAENWKKEFKNLNLTEKKVCN